MGKLYVVCGDDEFAIKERARARATELAGGSPEENQSVEIIAGNSDEAKPEEIVAQFLDAVSTPAFLSSDKLVWLRHFPDFGLFSAKNATSVYKAVVALLSQPLPADLTVLMDGLGLDINKSFGKSLKAADAVIEVLNLVKTTDRRYSVDRNTNIKDLCKAANKSIASDAVQYLTETLGGDTGTLFNELEKLFCYTSNKQTITLNDCQTICCRTLETVSWEFTGAITSRSRAKTLALLHVLLRQNETEMRLLASLSYEFNKQIQTKLAMRQLNLTQVQARTFDMLPASLKEKFPDNPLLKLHHYRAFKMCETAMSFSDAELRRNLELIRNASLALVSGGGDRRLILEQLVINLTSPMRP